MTVRKIAIAVLSITFLIAVSGCGYNLVTQMHPQNQNTVTYNTYGNTRFGFIMDYPKDFIPQRPPDNNDGLEFKSKDGLAILIGSGGNNAGSPTPWPLDQYITWTVDRAKGGVIKYQHIEKTWFVISWVKDGTIYYDKTFWGPGSTNEIDFQYPTSQAYIYDEICAHISNGFHPGNLNEYGTF